MSRALALARRGLGRVEPNPMVGCVIVRDGRVAGEGYHAFFGGPHAEVQALRSAGAAARGGTAYVTLEPCCHHGKTPPCTDALIQAGIARVVAAMRDPFERVAGGGFEQLRRAGIGVSVGLGGEQARRLNAPYLVREHHGRPWVILKWAQSLDGKIATRTGDSKWISSPPSRALVHRLRGRVDAVIVGVNTVIADDPLLTCRQGSPRRVAARLVLDPSLRIPRKSKLVQTARRTPTVVATRTASLRTPRARTLGRAGVMLMGLRRRGAGLDLSDLLARLARRGMTNVLVEGGGETLGRFLDAGLADEALVFVSRRLIGGRDATPALGGAGALRLADVRNPAFTQRRTAGQDDVYRLVFTDAAGLAED